MILEYPTLIIDRTIDVAVDADLVGSMERTKYHIYTIDNPILTISNDCDRDPYLGSILSRCLVDQDPDLMVDHFPCDQRT